MSGNSNAVESWYREVSNTVRGGYLRYFTQTVENIRVPVATYMDRMPLAELAQCCADATDSECTMLEQEIDECVEALYKL